MADGPDILIFAEDAGAANYVAPLPEALSERGFRAVVLSDGIATESLRRRGVATEAISPGSTAGAILARLRPRLVLVGTAKNPDTLGLELVAAARAAGIPSVGAVDARMSADQRFRGRGATPLAYAPDWLLVPDEWTNQAFVALGFPAERAVACGNPHYDYVLAIAARLAGEDPAVLRQRVLPGAAANQRVVVFVGGGSARRRRLAPHPPIREYTLAGRETGAGRTEIVLEEFLDAIQSVTPRPYLALRPHPKDPPGDYAAYRDEFDLIASDGSPLELVYAADLVVGATSTLLMEAALLGRPTLSILPRAEEKEWLPSIRAGITPYVTTRAALQSALLSLLQDGSLPLRCDTHHGIVSGPLQRTVAVIEDILGRRAYVGGYPERGCGASVS